MSRRRDEANGRQRIEHGFGGQVERSDDVFGQHARAVHRRADLLVLLEDGDGPAGRSKAAARPPGRRGRHQRSPHRALRPDYTSRCDAQTFRPRSSQRPRAVIQNDCRISRRSRQKLALALIEQVVAELAGARQIARGIDLREAGQARPHAVPRFVAGNRAERQHARRRRSCPPRPDAAAAGRPRSCRRGRCSTAAAARRTPSRAGGGRCGSRADRSRSPAPRRSAARHRPPSTGTCRRGTPGNRGRHAPA